MELLLNIVNGWNLILDIWLGSEYASAWNNCEQLPLRERCSNTEFFLVRIFLYSVQIRENTDQKKLRIWTLFYAVYLCCLDPEVCSNGFTIQMTLKLYRDSVFNKSRLFILDSGATSSDSRGISIWVVDGSIGSQVSTRDEIWCLRKILEPYVEKWLSLTLTWHKDEGK